MSDFTKHLLPYDDDKMWMIDYIHLIGLDAFTEYEYNVNNALDVLAPGRHYNIDKSVPTELQDLFVKFCCSYIQKHPEILFFNDYTKIGKCDEYGFLKTD